MASEISVERQFRFHCSCGATTVSGERKITCSGCGDTLGIRRVRRHRQSRDSVAYYGSSFPIRRVQSHRQTNTAAATPISPRWTIPVHRVEKRRQSPNIEAAIPRPAITARLTAWLKSALANCAKVLKDSRVGNHIQHTNTVLNVEAQEVHDIPEEPRALLVINGSAGMPLREGVHVKVGPTRPDGKPHPHAGKTGRITKFADDFLEPYLIAPSAMIKLDPGIKPQGFIWVSNECLEVLPEDTLSADL